MVVDWSLDVITTVKGLVAKHGEEVIHKLRCEPFGEPEEEMMNMLKGIWIKDITVGQESTPVGNVDDAWGDLPEPAEQPEEGPTSGQAGGEQFEAVNAQLAESGDPNADIYVQMNEAMARGDQAEAARLMRLIAGLPEEEDA